MSCNNFGMTIYWLTYYFEAIQIGHYKDYVGIAHSVMLLKKIRMQNYICAACPTLWEICFFRKDRKEWKYMIYKDSKLVGGFLFP